MHAIRDTGYDATLPSDATTTLVAEQEARDRAQEDEYQDLRRKALFSGAAGVVAMLLSMPLMHGDRAHGVMSPDPFMNGSSAGSRRRSSGRCRGCTR